MGFVRYILFFALLGVFTPVTSFGADSCTQVATQFVDRIVEVMDEEAWGFAEEIFELPVRGKAAIPKYASYATPARSVDLIKNHPLPSKALWLIHVPGTVLPIVFAFGIHEVSPDVNPLFAIGAAGALFIANMSMSAWGHWQIAAHMHRKFDVANKIHSVGHMMKLKSVLLKQDPPPRGCGVQILKRMQTVLQDRIAEFEYASQAFLWQDDISNDTRIWKSLLLEYMRVWIVAAFAQLEFESAPESLAEFHEAAFTCQARIGRIGRLRNVASNEDLD